jgi:hypothetical protein
MGPGRKPDNQRKTAVEDKIGPGVGKLHDAGRDYTLRPNPPEAKERVVMIIFHCDIKAHSRVHRAWPFLDMLREARKQNADIIWGL